MIEVLRIEGAKKRFGETEALRAFETDVKERSSMERIDGQLYWRLMRPLFVEASCLKCHASQGYKEGDIRGGISVSVLMMPYLKAARAHQISLFFGHLCIGLFGLGGLLVWNFLLRR